TQEIIASNLKEFRKRHKLTQEQLAKKLKITQSAVASLESNRRNPGSKLLKDIADFFDVSQSYLKEESENKKEPYISRESLVSNFLKYLIDSGVIKDSENIDKVTQEMIMNMIKKEIDIIKKGDL
ncbi:helix-turn-helix transcriptional regulator, partial [uncultured Clostridium sp.]|uniref:helix-turn-helix domain-containing protein n=1 Tax=uncultured Clostridium sp. TaxID=59620 RepID=UPI0025E30E0D